MPCLLRTLSGIACGLLLAVPLTAQVSMLGDGPPSPRSFSSAALRRMTAAQFQQHVDEEGAKAFTRRVVKDIDPHSPEEPNYDIILEHIAEGSNAWLKVAGEIAPYVDPTFGEGLRVAIADALIVNPAGVLRNVGTEEHFDQACGYPFVRQTSQYLQRHQKAALAALNRVRDPALSDKKTACHKQLMDLPTATATAQ